MYDATMPKPKVNDKMAQLSKALSPKNLSPKLCVSFED
jgi:hypothetical protein